MTIAFAHANFTGGEMARTLSARYDVAKYGTGCVAMQNFIAQLHGGARFRPGMYMLEDLGEFGVVLPFQFNATDTHALVLTEHKLRVIDGWGWVDTSEGSGTALEVATPWAAEDLYDLHYHQSGDVVYFAHPGYALRKLSREALRTWTLETVTFEASIDPPSTSLTGSWHGRASGTATLRYKVATVSADGGVSIGSDVIEVTSAYAIGDWIANDYVTLSWGAVTGAESYNVYRESSGYYGLVGVVTDGLSSPTFRDDHYEADTGDSVQEAYNPFDDNRHPATVCGHNQRLTLGSGTDTPTRWCASQVGNFENFNKSRPTQDDDMLEFIIYSGKMDKIQWMESFGELLIGTEGAEYKVTGADGGVAITPASVECLKQSAWGSARIRPLLVGTSVLHVQRQQSRVRDLFYSYEVDKYSGNDLSIMSEHLFDGHTIKQWAYQQAPDSVVWVVRDDGVLLGLTYLKEHNIWGWHRHVTQGEVLSVASVGGSNGEDDVYFIVKREIDGVDTYFVEKLMPKWREADGIENAFFVDCGRTYDGAATTTITGLGHLNGMGVVALADGIPLTGLTVADGEVELPFAASVVHVGLAYTGVLAPTSPEVEVKTGSTLGKIRGYGPATIRMHESVGGEYARTLTSDRYVIKNSPAMWGEAVPPRSDDVQLSPPPGYDTDGSLYFFQDYPLPMTIISLTQEVSYGER